MDQDTHCKTVKFADDTKLGGGVDSETTAQLIQRDFAHLCNWANLWQINFNVKKCKILHIGCNNSGSKYTMNGMEIGMRTLKSI